MGAAESRTAPSALEDEAAAAAPAAPTADRLVRVPNSLTGGQAELRAVVAALMTQCGGALQGVEERGGIELEVSQSIEWEWRWLECRLMRSIKSLGLSPPPPNRSPTSRRRALGTAASLASR